MGFSGAISYEFPAQGRNKIGRVSWHAPDLAPEKYVRRDGETEMICERHEKSLQSDEILRKERITT